MSPAPSFSSTERRNFVKDKLFLYNVNCCLLLNSTIKGSTQFEQYDGYENADILITWSFNGKSYNYGLYTVKPNIHVGELAAMYMNGGGHAKAAGGETKDFIFI